jgi:hypothetical protein
MKNIGIGHGAPTPQYSYIRGVSQARFLKTATEAQRARREPGKRRPRPMRGFRWFRAQPHTNLAPANPNTETKKVPEYSTVLFQQPGRLREGDGRSVDHDGLRDLRAHLSRSGATHQGKESPKSPMKRFQCHWECSSYLIHVDPGESGQNQSSTRTGPSQKERKGAERKTQEGGRDHRAEEGRGRIDHKRMRRQAM